MATNGRKIKLPPEYQEIGNVEVGSFTRDLVNLKVKLLGVFVEPLTASESCPKGSCPIPIDKSGKKFLFYKKDARKTRKAVFANIDKLLNLIGTLSTQTCHATMHQGVGGTEPKKKKKSKKS